MAQLFEQLSNNTIYSLNNLPKIIDKVFPLRSKHRIDLPFAINDLSALLTVQRSELRHSYWSTARFASAYLRYFFPWNVIRLTRLLQGLNICEPYPDLQSKDTSQSPKLDMRNFNKNKKAIEASQEQMLTKKNMPERYNPKRLLVDLGSGPLTLPIALWFAKPEWRKLPLVILCLDTSPQPLEYGKQIFYALAGNDSPWQIVTRRNSLSSLYKELRNIDAKPWLLTGANVINELFMRTTERYEENFTELSSLVTSFCSHKDTVALFVEPGTRLGGKNIALLREKTLENNLKAIAPCVHNTDCPLQDSRSWCHFTFSVEGAPRWLMDLSQDAFLTKTALSLSFILMQNGLDADNKNVADKKIADIKSNYKEQDAIKTEDVCIVSAPFKIPLFNSFVRYACSSKGLIIVKDAVNFTSGSTVKVIWSGGGNNEICVDKKTGVRILASYRATDVQSKIDSPRSRIDSARSRKEQIIPSISKNRKDSNQPMNSRAKKEHLVPASAANKKEQSVIMSNNDKKEPDAPANVNKKKKQKTLANGKNKKGQNSFFGKQPKN